MFPYAKAAGAGEQGNDVLDTPGLVVEVKARDQVTIPAALRQARQGAVRTSLEIGDGDHGVTAAERAEDIEEYRHSFPTTILIHRHNGQGPAQIGQWSVSMSLEDFEQLWISSRRDPYREGTRE